MPFGRNIILLIPLLLSICSAFLEFILNETDLYFDNYFHDEILPRLIVGSSLAVSFLYPFGVVVFVFLADIIAFLFGFLVGLIFSYLYKGYFKFRDFVSLKDVKD